MKSTIVLLPITLVTMTCQPADSPILVSLESGSLDTPIGQGLVGLTNIFFAEPDEEAHAAGLRTPDHWKGVEVAAVLTRGDWNPVYAARFEDTSGETRYVIDTNGDLDLGDEQALALQPSGERRLIATVDLQIPPGAASDTSVRAVPYQIVVIDEEDGYTYARIVEYRRGTIAVAGERYDVMLRPRSRTHPIFAVDEGTLMFVDQNQDGMFDQRAGLTQGGARVANEQVNLLQPFLIGDHGFRATHIDAAGASLTLEPTSVAQAPSVGFDAPDLVAQTLFGTPVSLGELDGRVVLIEFWSTSCSFSERARSTLNEIAATYSKEEFTWLAISRESDVQEVGEFLREHHRAAEVVVADSATWREYNPTITTPTYYVIDPSGVIRLREQGASAASTVAKVVGDLLAAR